MKVELKDICEQLTEAVGLKKNHQVAACFSNITQKDDAKIIGWTVVKRKKDGTLEAVEDKYDTLKDLINAHKGS